MDNLLDKPLPSNDEAEQIVLGSIILDNDSGESAFKLLVPKDFYNPIKRRIFQAMLELHEMGVSIDPISIGENLKSHGQSTDAIGGVSAITGLALGLPHFKDTTEYVELIKRHSVARQVIRVFNARTQDLLAGEEPVEDILERSESELLSLSSRVHATDTNDTFKGFHDLEEIVPSLEQQFINYNLGISSGSPTGMKELDELLDGGGLQPGGVYLIGASEKTGKTSLALDWAYHAAVIHGYTVPIVTLEMSRENLAKRLYSAHTGIPYYMFRPGFYDSPLDDSYSRAIAGLKDFGKFPIKIADKLFGINEIGRNLRRVVEMGQKSGKLVKYAVIDYLQLVNSGLAGSVNREREVSSISRGLKMLAAELGIALVVMSSLNRENLKEGQEPTAFNLRDSGALAFDCEALILLHNPAYIPGKPYEPRKITDITMILASQRNGPTGRIPLKFIGPYMQFMTESQYRTHFKKPTDELPQSVGQRLDDDRGLDKLWDEHQTEKDRTGPDVEW